jgi:5-methylthioadenosine/S-adenosylhomocysteine deaminase
VATKRTILKNGCVLTMDQKIGNFRRADGLIDGTKIVAVGPDLQVGEAELIDASTMIVS